MSLTFVSLGLFDAKDITLRGLEAVKSADIVYLENYTSILQVEKAELESFYGVSIILASRELVEADDNEILLHAKQKKVVLLIVGDVFSATTHSDLFLRAQQSTIQVDVIHNASILNAIGITGLQLYQFGKTTSLVFFESDWKPQSAYDVIVQNKKMGLHTLVLLDIKTAEASKENLAKAHFVAQPSRYMNIQTAISQLREIENERNEGVFLPETKIIGVARIGSPTEYIKYGTVSQVMSCEFGPPLHSLIIPGKLHFHEEELLELWK